MVLKLYLFTFFIGNLIEPYKNVYRTRHYRTMSIVDKIRYLSLLDQRKKL